MTGQKNTAPSDGGAGVPVHSLSVQAERLSSPTPEQVMSKRDEIIEIMREHLQLTCGRFCEREMTDADEDDAYGVAADAILALLPPPEEEGAKNG